MTTLCPTHTAILVLGHLTRVQEPGTCTGLGAGEMKPSRTHGGIQVAGLVKLL